MRNTAGRQNSVVLAVWAHSDLTQTTVRAVLEDFGQMTRPTETDDGDGQLASDEPGNAAAVPA
jgi:hypothetical protein